MQGELSEIDVRSILQLVELGQRTGQLLVRTYAGLSDRSGFDPNPQSLVERSRFVFFAHGEIVYAGDPEAGVARLRDLLLRYPTTDTSLNDALVAEHARSSAPEYGCLWALIENRTLTPQQAREMLISMVRETLFELLSLHQGHFIFEMDPPLTPQLLLLEISPLVAEVAKQIQEWKHFYPYLQCPDQCPVLVNHAALRQALPVNTMNALIHYADSRTSLRQLAYRLNRDLLTVARAIYPCVQRGWIQLGPAVLPERSTCADPASPQVRLAVGEQSRQVSSPPQVVCIDDAETVQHLVQAILERRGYEVTSISDPIQALSRVFTIKPALILCDITMPNLDGYELCAMLRQSVQFHQVPIIMLTGKDGFIDRVRAKMVGATAYLAKPFSADELVMLVERYLPHRAGGQAIRSEVGSVHG
jgi:twitching motility two-component system response regulator PilG